ncbi:Thioredoxin-like proteins and domains [Candidatus Blochmanniella floridana]|uniref:Fe/S biogenesis protein NfuA n=1 Tax=Blochmanniella floridana TaxID=203907 RepID=NFUA_BLOFL|nr:RecName: Full=Fe/S biogenesis protein NfuA [Candidatus Blochmannia floridanus]CAD83255.1 Thioredoxin-like proteins and domains [Candidatus Blochmannia floridanus]
MLHITDTAQKYLIKLLSYQKKSTQIRFSVKNPGTPHAQCNISYYLPKTHHNSKDIEIKFSQFSIYLEKHLIPFIQKTTIDIVSNDLGIQLSIKSPNLYHSKNDNHVNNTQNNINYKSPTLENQIKHILTHQINPQLAMHGGSVSLVKITSDSIAILKFHGGCNGCAMAFYTIKEGIEKTLKKLCPELNGVIDSTQHQPGTHSFFK